MKRRPGKRTRPPKPPGQTKPSSPGRPRPSSSPRKDPKAASGGARSRSSAARPGRDAVVAPVIRWWTPWLAGLGAVLWLLVLANAAMPVIRCSAVWANKLLFLAVMLVPWCWLRVARTLSVTRWRMIVTIAAVACGLAGPWLAWRNGAWSVERKEISSVTLPAGGRVVAREERPPGSLHYRMVARQEREFIPGVMVVRRLARHDDAHGGLVELLDSDTVRIRPARVIGEVPVIVKDLKPWAWW